MLTHQADGNKSNGFYKCVQPPLLPNTNNIL